MLAACTLRNSARENVPSSGSGANGHIRLMPSYLWQEGGGQGGGGGAHPEATPPLWPQDMQHSANTDIVCVPGSLLQVCAKFVVTACNKELCEAGSMLQCVAQAPRHSVLARLTHCTVDRGLHTVVTSLAHHCVLTRPLVAVREPAPHSRKGCLW